MSVCCLPNQLFSSPPPYSAAARRGSSPDRRSPAPKPRRARPARPAHAGPHQVHRVRPKHFAADRIHPVADLAQRQPHGVAFLDRLQPVRRIQQHAADRAGRRNRRPTATCARLPDRPVGAAPLRPIRKRRLDARHVQARNDPPPLPGDLPPEIRKFARAYSYARCISGSLLSNIEHLGLRFAHGILRTHIVARAPARVNKVATGSVLVACTCCLRDNPSRSIAPLPPHARPQAAFTQFRAQLPFFLANSLCRKWLFYNHLQSPPIL